MCSSKMILNSGEEERRNDERSEELAKATNELASEEFLRSKNPTRTGKYIYKNAAFKDKKHFTIYCEARNVVPSLVGVLFLISEKVYLYISHGVVSAHRRDSSAWDSTAPNFDDFNK